MKSRRSTDAGSFYLESLGCAKNQVDSELMISALERVGWRLVDAPENAEVLIVNTCGFISDAKRESIETGLELKTRYPGKRVYLAGCLTERYAGELKKELPELDGFIGNKDPSEIARLVGAAGGRGRLADGSARGKGRAPLPPSGERTRLLSYPGSAYVKVAEGCRNRCTYCAIPLIRGELLSRERAEVRAEVERLLARGIHEIILIAQDLGSFGADRGAGELPRLLADISSLPGSFWIRLLYVHPDHFPTDILALMRDDPRLLPYFDLPFQHAAPKILSAMGRRGDPGKNLALVRRIRKELPRAVVRSTFLVGFPGETATDFERLLEFQREASLDWLGVFTYSREEDTPAHDLGGRVPKREADRRKSEVELAQIPITEKKLDRHIGEELEVLVEERIEGGGLSLGRAYLQAPDVDGLVVVDADCVPGAVVPVRITRRNGVDLEGEPLGG